MISQSSDAWHWWPRGSDKQRTQASDRGFAQRNPRRKYNPKQVCLEGGKHFEKKTSKANHNNQTQPTKVKIQDQLTPNPLEPLNQKQLIDLAESGHLGFENKNISNNLKFFIPLLQRSCFVSFGLCIFVSFARGQRGGFVCISAIMSSWLLCSSNTHGPWNQLAPSKRCFLGPLWSALLWGPWYT